MLVFFAAPLALLSMLVLANMRTAHTVEEMNRLALGYAIGLCLWAVLVLSADYVIRLRQLHEDTDTRTVRNLVLVTALVLTIVLPLAGTATGAESRLANLENRELAAMPELKMDTITSLPWKFESYFNDHFGFRGALVKWNSTVRVEYLKTSTSPEVVLGENRWLFHQRGVKDYRGLTSFTESQLQEIVQITEARSDWLAARGIYFLAVVVPNKETIYPEYLPKTATRVQQKTKLDQYLEYFRSNSDIRVLDLRTALLVAKTQYPVYYRTDTHWNNYGAFVGYCEILTELSSRFPGLQPPSTSDYDITLENASYSGDLARMLALPEMFKESGTPRVVFKTGGASELVKVKKIFVFKDSFFDALEPYFSTHFGEVVTAPVWGGFDGELLEGEQPDVVVQICVERSI
jgi:hypothetical protein